MEEAADAGSTWMGWEGGSKTAATTTELERERGRGEREQDSQTEKGRRETPTVTTQAQKQGLAPDSDVQEEKAGGSPLLRWTPSKCANLCLLYLLNQQAFFSFFLR